MKWAKIDGADGILCGIFGCDGRVEWANTTFRAGPCFCDHHARELFKVPPPGEVERKCPNCGGKLSVYKDGPRCYVSCSRPSSCGMIGPTAMSDPEAWDLWDRVIRRPAADHYERDQDTNLDHCGTCVHLDLDSDAKPCCVCVYGEACDE